MNKIVAGIGLVIVIAVVGVVAYRFGGNQAVSPLIEGISGPQDDTSSAGSNPLSAGNTFVWKGLAFEYPIGWQVEAWHYGSPAMAAEGKYEEVGFLVYKPDPAKSAGNAMANGKGLVYALPGFMIQAGGPQLDGSTCASIRASDPHPIRCAELRLWNNEMIPMVTASTEPETVAAFEIIVRTAKD